MLLLWRRQHWRTTGANVPLALCFIVSPRDLELILLTKLRMILCPRMLIISFWISGHMNFNTRLSVMYSLTSVLNLKNTQIGSYDRIYIQLVKPIVLLLYLPIRRARPHRLPESFSLPCPLRAIPACPQNRIESNIARNAIRFFCCSSLKLLSINTIVWERSNSTCLNRVHIT